MRVRSLLCCLTALATAAYSSASGSPVANDDGPTGAEVSNSPSDEESFAVPVQLSPTFPRESVDHVVTYAAWRGWGPRDGDRATVTRHGALVRLETHLLATRRSHEPELETSFANIATGASLSFGRGARGVLAGVTLWAGQREAGRPSLYRRRLVLTEESQEIAGERCAVWRGEPESEGPIYTACITTDGVMLRDTVLGRNGYVLSERLALQLSAAQSRLLKFCPQERRWISPFGWAAHWPAVERTTRSP